MNTIATNKPMTTDAIYFEDGGVLENKIVFFVDCFMIVADNMNDDTPTWYNVRLIKRIEGVRECPKEETRKGQRIVIF